MKLGILIADATAVGGAERCAHSLAAEFVQRKAAEVCIYSVWHGRVPETSEISLKAISQKKPNYNTHLPKLVYKLRRSLVRDGVQILVAIDPMLVLVAKFATLGTNIKIFGWEHTDVEAALGSKLRVPVRRFIAKIQIPHVVLTRTAEAGYRSFGLAGKNIRKISNIMPDFGDVRFLESNKAEVRNGAVFVGRLVASKNVEYLVKIWPEVRSNYPAATLDIIGDGTEYEKIKIYIEESGQSNYIRLLGRRQVNANLLSRYKIIVSASQLEAQPMSLLEGALCGLRVISFAVSDAIVDLCKTGPVGWHHYVENGKKDLFLSAVVDGLDSWNQKNAMCAIEALDHQKVNKNIVEEWNEFLEIGRT